jgi:hypothetical protein
MKSSKVKTLQKEGNLMQHYVQDIAQIDKKDRFSAITKVLNDNQIGYVIQRIPANQALGNIIVEFNPSASKKIVITAHYDNVLGTPGANDNAAACSILLNLILDYRNTNNHIEFVFFDLEEQRFLGSEHYMRSNQSEIAYAINLDMCGLGENILFSCHHVCGEDRNKFNDLFVRHQARLLEKLPPGDSETFIHNQVSTFFIVNSTTRDLAWFSQYANGVRPQINPDFSLTMHKANDTIDTINFDQVEKIFLFVNDLIKCLLF